MTKKKVAQKSSSPAGKEEPKQTSAERAFDLRTSEGAFKQVEATLRALPAGEVQFPNCDAQDSAVAALALVDLASAPERRARFAQLPKEVFEVNTIERLEEAAWATWFVATRARTEIDTNVGAKVDLITYENSGKHLARMLKLIEYHVGDLSEVAAELAGIRAGIGYQDRASDLVRAAALFETHKAELEGDSRLFEENAADVAREYAREIVQALRAAQLAASPEWADARNRAWSLLNNLYSDVKAAADFLYRNDPAERALFPSLHSAVGAGRPRRQKPSETVDSASPALSA